MFGAGGLALYAGLFERHWLEIVYKEIAIGGLPATFDGMRVAQLSDIHLDEFTEPFLLRESIDLNGALGLLARDAALVLAPPVTSVHAAASSAQPALAA